MAVAAPAADFAKLLFRTPPYNRMSSARRFQLLSQARSVRFAKGEPLFHGTQPPPEVCMILTGTVAVATDLPGERETIALGELGPGECAGWVPALAGAPGARAVALTEVQGLMVSAPAFLEIARYDPALREDMFSRVRKGEVWRAVLAEMARQNGRISSARVIVESIFSECITRDWPEDEDALEDPERLWIVAGGEGVMSGDRWHGPEGVLWARLIGLPAEKVIRALAEIKIPSRESVRIRPDSTVAQSSKSKVQPAGASSTTERPASGKAMAPEPRPAPAPVPARPRRTIWGALGVAFGLAALAAGGAAWWASQQVVTEPLTAAGTLTFVGERRSIAAGIRGTISDWGLKPGARLDRGSVIAIIQPPMDEFQTKSLTAAAALAQSQAEFCEAALAGRPTKPESQPKHLVELASELSTLRSDQRVLSAVERGATTDYTLSPAERQRVTQLYAAARAENMDRLSNASRDASARRDELRDAEAELREAQGEMTVQSKAYAEIINSKEKEMRKDSDAAQRALAVVKRQVEQKQDAVNRLRKEIAAMSLVVEPTAQPADDASAALPSIKAGIAQIEEQMQRHAEAFRREASGHEAALARLRADAAPRQIETLQPGLVLEAAPLKVGSVVAPDTVLGRLTTRQAWEVECKLSPGQLAALRRGQDITIVTVNPDGSTMRLKENLNVTNAQVDRPHITLFSSRDDWHDGTPVRIETSVVKCTLLDQWLTEIRWTIGI